MLFLLKSASNNSLEKIDMSWNQIRRRGAVAICKGLQVSLVFRQSSARDERYFMGTCEAIYRPMNHMVLVRIL